MKIRIILILLVIALFTSISDAQYQDLEGDYSVGLSLKLAKKWTFKVQEELRLKSNSSQLKKHFTDFQIKYKHTKWLTYQFGSRYYFEKTKDEYWNAALRLNVDFVLKKKYKKLTLSSRSRIQSSLNAANTIGRLHSDEALLREKVSIKYNWKKYRISPFISGELFLEDYFTFDGKNPKRPLKVHFESNKYRLKLGAEWKMTKRDQLQFYYGFQQELHQVINQKDFLISIGYFYKLKLKSKKKKDEK